MGGLALPRLCDERMSQMKKTHDVVYTYLAPQEVPEGETSWDVAVDYPGVRVLVRVLSTSTEDDERRPHPLYKDVSIATEPGSLPPLNPDHWPIRWVDGWDCWVYELVREFRAPTLSESEQDARAWGEEQRRMLDALVSARERRLRQREETISRAHARWSSVEPPRPRFE